MRTKRKAIAIIDRDHVLIRSGPLPRRMAFSEATAIGARQWLSLMAGTIVAGAPAIAPLTERIARSLPRGTVPAAESGASTAKTA